MERKLAAILAADVVGYGHLMGQDEAGTFARVRAHCKELFEPEIDRHRGHIFKLMGDGLLAEFGSVVDAVECAVVLQREMAERNNGLSGDQRIDIRMGVHLGDVIVEGDDRHGDAVNIAARLEQLAEPGGICVSGTVADHVKQKVALSFESRGEERLKNIAEPVAVYRVLTDSAGVRPRSFAWLAARYRQRRVIAALALVLLAAAGGLVWNFYPRKLETALALPDKPSIAVLPFENLSGDPEKARLADGITEDVITDLSRSRDLFVIARNSTEVYKGKAADVRDVGRELGVKYVLEGSIQTSSDRVRITAQLIEAATGQHVWSERYDRPLRDIFAVQDEVTQEIAGTLAGWEGAVAEADRAGIRHKPPASLQAYDYYLLGIEYKHRMTKEDNIKAQAQFRRAIDLDPGFARAYVGLAITYGLEIDLAYTTSVAQSLDNQLATVQRAIALDPSDSVAHMTLASNYLYRNECSQAAEEFERATSLNPNDADLLVNYGGNLFYIGNPKLGVEKVEQAIRLNPNYPMWYNYMLRWAYYYAGDFEKALAAERRIENPGPYEYAYLAMTYAQLGRAAEAGTAAAEVLRLDRTWSAERYLADTGTFARDTELSLFLDGVRKAGLPVCASDAQLKERPDIKRLAVCKQAQVQN